ncbi:MAG TPA: heme-binding protein [Polyangia bacterium]|nr:heme-binding protein [Polyangia bacterium]
MTEQVEGQRELRRRLALLIGGAIVSLSLVVASLARGKSPAETIPGANGVPSESPGQRAGGGCKDLPSAADLKKLLKQAAGPEVGGLDAGHAEWAAVVDRKGEICAVAVSTDDAAAAWPGSQAIAKAKAYTANAFSTDMVPLSTARLYTMAQPGHSLYGAGAANPFNPACLQAPGANGGPKLCGGTIVFGGGVPLYKGKTRVGGLGASGDTACADHEMAKRMRDKAGLNPPDGALADDIWFTKTDGPSIFAHPLCKNTWRNGKKIGEEPPAGAY